MPNLPLRLQVIDRVVEVLRSIQAGDDFFSSPAVVSKGFISEIMEFPALMVLSDSGGRIEYAGEQQYDEVFYLDVKGIVRASDDVITPLEKLLRDVRKAINDDSISGELSNLCVQVIFREPPDIDYGFEGTHFFAFFDQRIEFRISGNYGEL